MKSIAIKLWLGMMALVAVILTLLWLFQIVFLDSFYTNIRINEVKSAATSVVKEAGDLQILKNGLDELAYRNNLSAELLDPNGTTFYSVGDSGMMGQMPMMRNAARAQAVKDVLQGETVLLPMTHPRFNSKFMLIGLPVNVSGDLQDALIITLPLAPVEETANILKKQLLYISFILLATTLLLSYLLSKSFTKPILEINRVSMDMASGNLSARIENGRKDEIGKLAKTINHMGVELSKMDQLRKELIANVSHELRTPLSLIRGYAETIRDVSGDNAEKRNKQLGIIIGETERLSGIVEDILKLSQMQAGYLPLNVERFDLNELVDRVVRRYEILGEKSGVRIRNAGYGAEFNVEADEAKIEQVLYNLVNNAFNHSSKGGDITVEIQDGSDRVRVNVIDMGEGIAEEELPYIWERFYKADKSGSRNASGTGLGLAIVKNILDAHNVRYGVDSKQGKGSSFWFELRKIRI